MQTTITNGRRKARCTVIAKKLTTSTEFNHKQHEIDDDTTRSVVYVNLLTDGGTAAIELQ